MTNQELNYAMAHTNAIAKDIWENVCIGNPEDEDSWIEHGEFKDLFKEWPINQ